MGALLAYKFYGNTTYLLYILNFQIHCKNHCVRMCNILVVVLHTPAVCSTVTAWACTIFTSKPVYLLHWCVGWLWFVYREFDQDHSSHSRVWLAWTENALSAHADHWDHCRHSLHHSNRSALKPREHCRREQRGSGGGTGLCGLHWE